MLLQTMPGAQAAGREVTFAIKGLVCQTCAEDLVRRLEKIPSVAHAQFSLSQHRMSVLLKPGRVLSDQFIGDIVQGAGYAVETHGRAVAGH